jgi:hypothetical protein
MLRKGKYKSSFHRALGLGGRVVVLPVPVAHDAEEGGGKAVAGAGAAAAGRVGIVAIVAVGASVLIDALLLF